jgi:hypothetical protein
MKPAPWLTVRRKTPPVFHFNRRIADKINKLFAAFPSPLLHHIQPVMTRTHLSLPLSEVTMLGLSYSNNPCALPALASSELFPPYHVLPLQNLELTPRIHFDLISRLWDPIVFITARRNLIHSLYRHAAHCPPQDPGRWRSCLQNPFLQSSKQRKHATPCGTPGSTIHPSQKYLIGSRRSLQTPSG